jgi:hypothetical protein
MSLDQSLVRVYVILMLASKWSTSALSMYFTPKIINNECKCDWACFMIPKAGGIEAFVIPKWGQFPSETLVG